MLVSSLPKALVATQVNRAESVRSSFLILKSDSTPVGRISSRIVYLIDLNRISFIIDYIDFVSQYENYLGSLFESNRLLFMFHKMPIGFSPLASHWRTAGSPRRAVWFLNLISNCGGAAND